MTRDEFRETVFERDGHKCVCCPQPATAVHHILERKLFPDGGYLSSNGASLCADCHLKAETNLILPDEIREAAGISEIILPPGFDPSRRHCKWGNSMDEWGNVIEHGPLWDSEQYSKAMKLRFALSKRR